MSEDRYFDKFPIIQYSNTTAVDITARVVMKDIVYNDPYVFYPYDIGDSERPDQISSHYYDDSYKSWMVYLSNKIIDPYYEWYLQQDEFDNFIADKYSSVEAASTKISNYMNNWAGQENISVSRYNSLTIKQKGYYEPVYGFNNAVSAYSRKRKDWTINTNRIISYSVSNTNFVFDEIVNIVFNVNYTGTGQVLSNNGVLYIKNVSGYVLANTANPITGSSYIYGTESNVNTAFANSTLISNPIEQEEEEFYEPITYYEFERQKNEYNKTVRLLDNRYSSLVVSNLTDLLRTT